MEYIQYLNEVFKNVENFFETKNYYYEYHKCKENEDKKKIMLDYKISNETSDEILKIGYCKDCKTLLYHKDYK